MALMTLLESGRIDSVEVTETFGKTNKNGNLLYEVVRQWAELKMLL